MEIELKNITYIYNKINYKGKKILDQINLVLEKQQIHIILGAAGSGKTTLAELISGIILPTEGQITINNKQLDGNCIFKNIGIVFQNCEHQFLNETVKKELQDIIHAHNYRVKEADKRILSSLLMVGLNDSYLNRKISTLSTSEKQKFIFASVLILNPKIIILDSPLIFTTKAEKQSFKKFLRLLKNRYHKTIVIFSNDSDFALEFADYISILDNGKIIEHGKKMDVLTKSEVLKKAELSIPKIIEFEDEVLKLKKIKLGYRDEINDLIKDIYRNTY